MLVRAQDILRNGEMRCFAAKWPNVGLWRQSIAPSVAI